jgi:hypothetical protein
MTATAELEHSRALLLASRVAGKPASQLAQRLNDSVAVVSVDPLMPSADLTARVLVTTLRRGPGEIVLVDEKLPRTLVDELVGAAAAIDPTRPLRVSRAIPDRVTAQVHVGVSAAGHSIRVAPDGYGAHLASIRTAVIRPARPGTQLGAIYAAALSAGEVFKHTARVLTRRRVIHRHLRFCPVTWTTDLAACRILTGPQQFDLALLGVGAIGTGIVLLLREMDAEGTLLAVDRQRYAPENKGTYSLGGVAEVERSPWKVDVARQNLPRFDVTPFHEPVASLIQAIDDGRSPWPHLVLTALDSEEARRDAQRLWPDRLIDAATGDTMLGLHDHRHGLDPCMRCLFPVRRDEPSGAERVAEQLGLPVELLAQGDTVLTAEHLAGLTDDQQRKCAPHLGKPVCGLAHAVGLTDLDADEFMPSIPFVSLQAACLSVGRLLASQIAVDTRGNFIQYDSLIGPQAASIDAMRVRRDCTCRGRAQTIEKVRAVRSTIKSYRPPNADM